MSGPGRLRFLWSAANLLQARAPFVSGILSARLVQTAGTERMSGSALRLHCAACSGLLGPGSRVRLRKDRRCRRGRRNCSDRVRNRVVRTCSKCTARNYYTGSRKEDTDEIKEWAEVRGTLAESEALGSKRLSEQKEQSDVHADEGTTNKRVRKKRKKNTPIAAGFLRSSGAHGSQVNPSPLSSSFLFQPL